MIGAGINGAGVFRDLCAQGLTVAIVDKADYGGGTSAAPSRLIHGGIKYLETGNSASSPSRRWSATCSSRTRRTT